eukprot:scaffold5062_cov66-Attheya_sp.AAC.1
MGLLGAASSRGLNAGIFIAIRALPLSALSLFWFPLRLVSFRTRRPFLAESIWKSMGLIDAASSGDELTVDCWEGGGLHKRTGE